MVCLMCSPIDLLTNLNGKVLNSDFLNSDIARKQFSICHNSGIENGKTIILVSKLS